MPLSAGEKLGPYEILGPIGAGGMGEVYRALDPRLGREVAIKIAAARFSERFEREARAVAALNHPNICTLHDVGPNYLVMELVEGRPPLGPLPLDLALRYAAQIADALDGAHRKGIIHRDLKPANILVTKQGLKLLDFGLAKHVAPVSSDREMDKTLTKALTGEGTLLGTPQYMAPEQVEGKEADARTDIFAFGCVLYELLSGRRAFDGNTHASVIAKILAGEPPPLRELQPVTPRSLERVLATCLAKDPDERWQSAADLKHALALVSAEPAVAPAARAKRPWLWPATAGILLLAGLAAGWLSRPPQPHRSFQLSVNPPAGTEFLSAGTNAGNSALSPDGSMLAFSARSKGRMQIWIRPLDSSTSRALPGTEGGYYPFWAPDNRRIGFFADGRLKKIDVSGGPAQTICEASTGRGGAWNTDGVILFSAASVQRAIARVPAAGGTPAAVTVLSAGENAHYWPAFLPDGQHFLYLSRLPDQEKSAIWVTSLAAPGNRKRLVDSLSNAAYAGPVRAGLLLSETGPSAVCSRSDAAGPTL